ncbi:MAG: hypothetical protein ABI361_05420 [Nitrososphaera sp.]
MAPLGARTRRKGRRGISVVITSLMLVVAVSLFGSFLLSWGNSYFASQQVAISNQTNSRLNQVRESVVIEDAWFFHNNTGNFATVTIRNAGNNGFTVAWVTVNNSIAWNKGLPIQNATYSQVTFPLGWHSGDLQKVGVTTKSGTSTQQAWQS